MKIRLFFAFFSLLSLAGANEVVYPVNPANQAHISLLTAEDTTAEEGMYLDEKNPNDAIWGTRLHYVYRWFRYSNTFVVAKVIDEKRSGNIFTVKARVTKVYKGMSEIGDEFTAVGIFEEAKDDASLLGASFYFVSDSTLFPGKKENIPMPFFRYPSCEEAISWILARHPEFAHQRH